MRSVSVLAPPSEPDSHASDIFTFLITLTILDVKRFFFGYHYHRLSLKRYERNIKYSFLNPVRKKSDFPKTNLSKVQAILSQTAIILSVFQLG